MANIGEIKLLPYDDVPIGYLECRGQSLKVNEYPKLYMMLGGKYGKVDEMHFCLPNLENKLPEGMKYCIAFSGDIPKL